LGPVGREESTKKESLEPVQTKAKAEEYLTPVSENRNVMKMMGEMRKADIELKKLKQLAAGKMTFQARVGLSEEIAVLRSRITDYIREDGAVEAYGKKLLKIAEDFGDEIEGGDEGGAEDAPPPPPGGDEAPPDIGAEGGEGAGGPTVDKDSFDQIMTAVLSSLCPEGMEGGPEAGGPPGLPGEEGAPPGGGGGGDMQGVIDQAYEEFSQSGTIDVNGLVDQLSGGGEGGEGEFGPDEDLGGGEEPPGEEVAAGGSDIGEEAPFESATMRAAVKLIARLRESAKYGEHFRGKATELAERLKAHHPYLKELEEARPLIKKAKENESRLTRNVALLGRANAELHRLKNAFEEERQVSTALVKLLNEHDITDANKIAEAIRAEAVEAQAKAVEKEIQEDLTATAGTKGGKSGTSALGPGDGEIADEGSGENSGDAPGEKLDPGKGETPTKVGGEDQKGKEGGGEGKCNVATGADTTSHYSAGKSGESKAKKNGDKVVTESKDEEHDLIRIMRRSRSGAYRQL
jgi:hypothetical protein